MLQGFFRFVDRGGRLVEYLVVRLSMNVASSVVRVNGPEVFLDSVSRCILGGDVQILGVVAVIEHGLLF